MTFTDVCLALGIKQVCFGDYMPEIGQKPGCGLSVNRHRTGATDPFGVIHFTDRRMSKRALRRFLLLVVKRDRLADPLMLNDLKFDYLYPYLDSTEAGRLAGRLGVRLPAALSHNDRLRTLTLARKAGVHLSSERPSVYAWARRGLDD